MQLLKIFNITCLVLVFLFIGLVLVNLGKTGKWKRIPSVLQPAIMLVEEPNDELSIERFFKDQNNINLIREFHYGDDALQLKPDASSDDLHVMYYSKFSFVYVLIIIFVLFILSCVNIFFIEGKGASPGKGAPIRG